MTWGRVALLGAFAWSGVEAVNNSTQQVACNIVKDLDYWGSDIGSKNLPDYTACCDMCAAQSGCVAWSYDNGVCWVKSDTADVRAVAGVVSGTMGAPAPAPPPPLPPTPAGARAKQIISGMTAQEKYTVLNGVGWVGYDPARGYYVGNTLPVPRVGFPSIKMQDASQGFRTYVREQIGQVTAWPSCLAMGATWDEQLVFQWTSAMGVEFKAKGANVILGPSVNVHRVARNGRNGEYISGESPVLGAKLVASYVRGVQQQGVMAVVKHYVLNNQETNRDTINVIIDDRTTMEVYYPPFKAAVDAGVASVMCSYNLVNGEHACGNADVLNRDLKTRMGFTGFVMSDWWALHASARTTAVNGVDMNMPGTDGYFSPAELAQVPADRIDNMVERILRPLIEHGIVDNPGCVVPNGCTTQLYSANASSAAHTQLTRQLAAAGAVLLKNGDARHARPLPLAKGVRVAVVGSACDAKNDATSMLADWTKGNYYILGGSGRVIPGYVISIVAGLRAKGVTVSAASLTDDVNQAIQASNNADVVVACGGTTAHESADRPNLRLDQDAFIASVTSQSTKPVIVLAAAPGSFSASWRDNAAAVAVMFLGGQESGSAWADLLTGDTNFQGRLPVTIPANENDMTQPCPGTSCTYSEKLNIAWRALDGKPVAYPFGHGLSYTNFTYTWQTQPHAGCSGGAVVCMTVQIAGVGAAGTDTPQLYVGYPADAGEPPKQLKAFQKTKTIASGARESVDFALSAAELSIWDANAQRWTQSKGTFTFYVGASSRDIRLTATLAL